jgi:hypothetical protein
LQQCLIISITAKSYRIQTIGWALEDSDGPLRCQCTNLTSNEVTRIYRSTLLLVIGCRQICRLVVCQFLFCFNFIESPKLFIVPENGKINLTFIEHFCKNDNIFPSKSTNLHFFTLICLGRQWQLFVVCSLSCQVSVVECWLTTLSV